MADVLKRQLNGTRKRAAERDKRTERVYKKPPQRRRATKDEPRPRAEAKKRPTRETPATKKRAAVAERDKRTERKYDKPKPTPEYADLYRLQERINPDEVQRPYSTWRDTLPSSGQTGINTVGVGNVGETVSPVEQEPRDKFWHDKRPEGGPAPMIRAGVGPVAQLSSQAAHTYGYTPEAYGKLASIPTTLTPPQTDFDNTVAGFYRHGDNDHTRMIRGLPPNDSIRLISGQGGDTPGILAHEQAHGWWFREGLDNPAVQPEYRQRFDGWSASPGETETFEDGSAVQLMSDAGWAQRDLDGVIGQGIHYQDPASHPTELYARTVQFSPNSQRQVWPDEVRPYYSGFLQGMDTLQGGAPTGPMPRNEIWEAGPDANGRYGSPAIRRWR
jgi:hypothetical protein